MKDLLKQSASQIRYRDGYTVHNSARDIAEAALREFKDGDVDPVGLRDTSDSIKTTVAKWLENNLEVGNEKA
jgi:hypothetical protein